MPGKQINNAQVASYSKDLTPRASCALLISPPATPGTATRAWLSPDQQQAPDGWEGSRWKGEQWTKWCFQPLPRAEHCSFTAPGLEQVQGTRLQAQAEQMIYWQGAATATEMGTEAGVSSVTSPVLGQLARVSLQCPSPADGEGESSHKQHPQHGLQQGSSTIPPASPAEPPQPPSTELGKIQGTPAPRRLPKRNQSQVSPLSVQKGHHLTQH